MTELTLAERSVELVRAWTEAKRPRRRTAAAATRLATLLKDPQGLEFTIGFVDRVVRPDDHQVAARNLRRLAGDLPAFLPLTQKLLLRLGALVSFLLPALVVGVARATLRRMVGHLVVDARPQQLGRAISKLRSRGDRLNLNLLGEAVLGDGEAERRRDGTLALIERDDVDYVSVKVSSVASQLSMWAFDESVERVVKQLTPLYERAASGEPTFINLDMEEYKDLDLTVAVFTTILESFPDLEAGIVLQAYLPDALGAMQELQAWATDRRAAGGAPVKVRLVKGANLAMERVDATMHGWPLATWGTKRETDTNYKRVLQWALTPERVDAVRIGVAGQNLFDVAYAWLLAGDRDVRHAVDFEMLLGMDTGPVDAVRGDIGQLLLYTPVVSPAEFDVAISYLVRRLEENASSDNFMSAAFELSTDPSLHSRETQRFLESVAALDTSVPVPHRRQDRLTEVSTPSTGTFANTPDTDPSTEANREWARLALARASYTQVGAETVRIGSVPGPASLETIIHDTRDAAALWQARGSDVRAWILHQAASALGARRGDLVSVMAAEAGKTVAEADVEVSEAVDFANYYAEAARRLDAVDGATFVPDRLTVVTPPWNFPVAIPAGSVLAALAVGSGVIIKAAPQTRRCAAVMVEALWQAGVPRDVLRFVTIDEGPLSKALIAHSAVDRVILTGGWETAQLFRSWRPDLPLLAETSGKNAIVITPSADIDLAVADLVKSAFGHAGQKCSAASLAIVVGSVADSERFHRQLVDAVASLKVGHPDDPQVSMGPVIEPPRGKLLQGLTELGTGETWLLEPRQLGADSRVWTPGIRAGVMPGSTFHTTEYFGPVLGIMHASDLAEAIAWQNATDYGLTAGIHSLDADEVNTWLDTVEAGNLYVNRGITGAIVQRQPFGGWKRSSVGTTAKAGGPNYLTHLGTWQPRPLRATSDSPTLSAAVTAILDAAAPHLTPVENKRLLAAAQSDHVAWTREYGVAKDVSGLGVERNVFRYVPVPVTIRSDGFLAELVRVLLAAARTGAPVTVSSPSPLPVGLVAHARVETHQQWTAHVTEARPPRVRLLGGDARALAVAVDGDPDVAIYAGAVTPSGRVEALPFLQEQSISITNHRFGNHDVEFDRVLPRR
ncbi:bifunctional proline dehydrogenase/L-glutamate gamma-semialdehyde dehydrogenase [Aeromicrobium fastidiosum]|uniref:L-glutamate gamma-semialdehyde dehydrogenase n=1 Tax=Aeromicrobium fastidiosum TaxID=52699 RepID=A0A641AJS1_9ACTN|nr:bifunctional proline dehydrogenase/L-glutamate gamma-semialdehyde dehydrogenase [Aeromicrobium fastidiosum]KAA1375920.1 aldehyde dehydrogenase family protein [Aeromicrobium fastidiosum]MBP2392226.1 RHH-type proline utilization regulon transcriptional repressor/proline dehydrogenase/delta 1-pyrroline-5-carboxylate dehydrogenase [Aeromicrobium fastidiosum]